MTEPEDPRHDTEPDPESSIDETTDEAGEDDVAGGYQGSGDTYY